MADFGIRVSKDGVDVKTAPTNANKKDFILLSSDKSPIVYYSGFLEEASPGAGVTYTHNLGKYPMFFLFMVDSVSSPTYYQASSYASATTTTIVSSLSKVYLIILNEGS